jgi:hypothetical protein
MAPTQVHVISHTHWDREWYLTREDYRLRLIDLIDGVLDRMDRDDAFTFFHLDGQTIVLEDYLEVRPDQKERLRRRIGSGRVLVGPWYVMPDMFLVSGESLVRNLALGHRIAESFGSVMRAGYTPDPFGHVAQMPQILAGFGLDNAILWRGFGGPRAEYTWEGLDGTRTLLLHFPREGYCNGFRLPLLAPPARALEAAAVVNRERERSSAGAVLLMAGIDHTEPHPELLTLVGEIGTGAGIAAALSTLPAYVDGVRAAIAARGVELEVVRGELRAGEEYSNLLPGVLSARSYLKKSNVRAQALLEKTVEPLALFAWMAGESHPGGVIAYAWKTLIENHPHDSICGCSIDEVHDENDTRFARVLQVAEGQVKRSLRALARRVEPAPQGSVRFLVVNTDIHPFEGGVEVVLDLPVASAEAGRMLRFRSLRHAAPVLPCEGFDDSRDPRSRGPRRPVPGSESRGRASSSGRAGSRLPLAVRVERVSRLSSLRPRFPRRVSWPWMRSGLRAHPSSPPAIATRRVGPSRMTVLRVEVHHDGTLNVLDKTSGLTYRRVLELEDAGDVGDEYTFSPPRHRSSDHESRVGARDRHDSHHGAPAKRPDRIETSLAVPRRATARPKSDEPPNRSGACLDRHRAHAGKPVVGRTHSCGQPRTRPSSASAVPDRRAPCRDTSRADSAFGIVTRAAQREMPRRSSAPEAPVNAMPLQSVVDAGDAQAWA